jgi:hypothetical protein
MATEFMHEQDRISPPGFFVIEPDAIISLYEGHCGFLPIASAMVYVRRRSGIVSLDTARSITPEAKARIFNSGASRA